MTHKIHELRLEEKLKPDFRDKLDHIYNKGQYLLSSDIVQSGSSFQESLEGFYDLKWIYPGRDMFKSDLPFLEEQNENIDKIGRTPIDLIKTLDGFGDNVVIGKIVNNINELTYERVRESYNQPDTSKKFFIDVSLGLLGLVGGPVSLVLSGALAINNKDVTPLYWGIPLFLLGGSMAIYAPFKALNSEKKAEENLPKEIKRRKQAFWKLHNLSIKADDLIEEYDEYFD